MTCVQGNIIDDKAVQDTAGYGCYDIAVANILADVIILLQAEIAAHIKTRRAFHHLRHYRHEGTGGAATPSQEPAPLRSWK